MKPDSKLLTPDTSISYVQWVLDKMASLMVIVILMLYGKCLVIISLVGPDLSGLFDDPELITMMQVSYYSQVNVTWQWYDLGSWSGGCF